MAKRKRLLPRLNLKPLDELISVRVAQHGGAKGAPKKQAGVRQGAAVNQSCITMMSALLQGYVEEVFFYASSRLFKTLHGDDVIKRYKDTYYRWGNPNPDNMKRLFRRLGIDNVFDGLSWQKCSTDTITTKLDEINWARNRIAHGQKMDSEVTLAQVRNLRDFVEQFGKRFAAHVRKKLPKK